MLNRFTFGLDLGQTQDPTACVILEQTGDLTAEEPAHFHARHIERYPLRTAYPDIVKDVAEKMQGAPLRGKTTLVVDQTGVGRPVVEMLKGAGLEPIGVTIHGGDSVVRVAAAEWRVPKREIASVLQVLLQSRRLEIARALPEAALLVQELLTFKVRISAAGHDSYEAWREGAHDDLVLAAGLAAWYAERIGPGQRLRTDSTAHAAFWGEAGERNREALWSGRR